MTLVEVARALGVQTTEEIAEECGFAPEDVGVVQEALAAEMTAPTLVLDYRGGADARTRWTRLAKPPIRELSRSLGLDPRTGLKWRGKRR